MFNDAEILNQQNRLQTYRTTLGYCLGQIAKFGSSHAPPHLFHDVREARQNIRHIKDFLRNTHTEVDDYPDDDEEILSEISSAIKYFAHQVRSWFETLKYSFEDYEQAGENFFEWIIQVPHRRGYDRILVRGVLGEAQMSDVIALRESVNAQRTTEGWVVAARRISPAARDETSKEGSQDILFCYNFDELLDQVADFTGYLNWLESEIKSFGIDKKYIPLACTKDELDPITKQKLGTSRYDERSGWIDGYIDKWLDDPAKEHISILGEFGTGKTWFSLHYAWSMIQSYQEAKSRGIARPRLPLVIPLRDYAKAVTVESLFSEFFFRKYQIPIPNYSVFEQLNKMGKLLLIFDGFDEMAAKIDRQQMINNFWQLARIVVPGSKAILTCRSEHFPDAMEGRSLLNAEMKASTSNLTGYSPQFEVLELDKLNEWQIKQALSFRTNTYTVDYIMSNMQLLDLARRPVMIDLIIEALPDIEAGKIIDIARVYFYAVRRKMDRDIKQERTFTSLADKVYFMCELSWEMLLNDSMILNYRLFPDKLRKLFNISLRESKDLDHWHYDMMGQTMLIRNADGDYTPAHRSLLEFFVAYKFLAELGALTTEFTELVQSQVYIDNAYLPQSYTWSSYFRRERDNKREIKTIAPLSKFIQEPLSYLLQTFGRQNLSGPILEFMVSMSDTKDLWEVIKNTRGGSEASVGQTGGNAATVLRLKGESFRYAHLERTVLIGADLSNTDLTGAHLRKAILKKCDLTNCILDFAEMDQTDLTDLTIRDMGGILALAWSPDGNYLASGGMGGYIRIWQTKDWSEYKLLNTNNLIVSSLVWSKDGKHLISSSDAFISYWDTSTWEVYRRIEFRDNILFFCVSEYKNIGSYICVLTYHGLTGIIYDNGKIVNIKGSGAQTSICVSRDGKFIIGGNEDGSIVVWSAKTGRLIKKLVGVNALISDIIELENGEILVFKNDDYFSVYLSPFLYTDPEQIDNIVEEYYDGIVEEAIEDAVKENISENYDEFQTLYKQELSGDFNEALFDDLARRFLELKQPDYMTEIHLWASDNVSKKFNEDDNFIHYNEQRRLYSVGYVEIWNLKSKKRKSFKWSIQHRGTSIFINNPYICAIGKIDGSINIWDKTIEKEILGFKNHQNTVRKIAYHDTLNVFASGSDDASIRIWSIDINEHKAIREISVLKVQMSCHKTTLRGAIGLDIISPDNVASLAGWLVGRGAILE